jgi:hypothetical protein
MAKRQRTKWIKRAMWLGVLTFFVLITKAIISYPGGNRFDFGSPRYSFSGNYLCDLFSQRAYNGQENPGRPYALFGTYALALALLLYWQLITSLFANRKNHARCTRWAGLLAMVLSLFIATPLHDACIIIAVPLGLVAFVSATMAQLHNRERFMPALGVLSLLTCLINYLAFVFPLLPQALPSLQKASLITFLAWVLTGMLNLKLSTKDFRQLSAF